MSTRLECICLDYPRACGYHVPDSLQQYQQRLLLTLRTLQSKRNFELKSANKLILKLTNSIQYLLQSLIKITLTPHFINVIQKFGSSIISISYIKLSRLMHAYLGFDTINEFERRLYVSVKIVWVKF